MVTARNNRMDGNKGAMEFNYIDAVIPTNRDSNQSIISI